MICLNYLFVSCLFIYRARVRKRFNDDYKEIKIVNPISSDLDVLRNSIFDDFSRPVVTMISVQFA